jgi:DNA repair protein RadC
MRIYETTLAYNIVQLGDVETLDEPGKVTSYLRDAVDRNPCQETFWVICLDRKNKPMSRTMVSLGTLGSTLVHPREVFKVAILASAAAIIVAHNHPSGDPAPSSADVRVTRTLREAAGLIDIPLLDHVIVGTPEEDPNRLGYYSFRDAGVL